MHYAVCSNLDQKTHFLFKDEFSFLGFSFVSRSYRLNDLEGNSVVRESSIREPGGRGKGRKEKVDLLEGGNLFFPLTRNRVK